MASAISAQKPLLTIPGNFDDFYVDQLANVYTIKGDVIRKYLPSGELQYELAPKRFGKLTKADFSDPLRPLLYYRDQGLVQVLDNTLSEQGAPVDLWSTLETNIWLACLSIDNHFWFYDTDNFELIRTDRNFEEISRSGNLIQVLGHGIMPEWMVERNSLLYISDPEYGVMMFDLFGTYIKTLPVKGLDRFQVIREILVYNEENEICEYRPLDFETTCLDFPEPAHFAQFMKDKIYLLNDKGVVVYQRGKTVSKE
jgi:hypothetical protein